MQAARDWLTADCRLHLAVHTNDTATHALPGKIGRHQARLLLYTGHPRTQRPQYDSNITACSCVQHPRKSSMVPTTAQPAYPSVRKKSDASTCQKCDMTTQCCCQDPSRDPDSRLQRVEMQLHGKVGVCSQTSQVVLMCTTVHPRCACAHEILIA